MPADNRTLIQRMKEGDREAGDLFFSKYIGIIYRTFLHNVEGAQEQDLRNLTQDVCLTIVKELPDYDPHFAVITWVNKLVLRHRMAFFREREKHHEKLLPLEAPIDPTNPESPKLAETLTAPGPDPLTALKDKEEALQEEAKLECGRLLLRRFLAALPDNKDRDVFTDRQLLGLSYMDIAQKHDLSLDAVKARLRRTRQKWAAFLKEHKNT